MAWIVSGGFDGNLGYPSPRAKVLIPNPALRLLMSGGEQRDNVERFRVHVGIGTP